MIFLSSHEAKTGYFGKNEWQKFTSGLKNLNDALQIRRRLLISFEEAENDPSIAQELMNYVIVGGIRQVLSLPDR